MFVCLTDLSVHTSSWRNPQSGNSIPEIYKNRADLLTQIYTVKRCAIQYAYYKPGTRVVACKSSLKLPRDCRRFKLHAADRVVCICCSWFFIPGNFYFSFVSISLAYITIPKNKRKTKITWDKKLTTTYIYVYRIRRSCSKISKC